MGEPFLMSHVSSTFSVNGILCRSPESVSALTYGLGMQPGNYYTNPVGSSWGTVGVFLLESEVNAIGKAASIALTISFSGIENGDILVSNLTPIRSQRVTDGAGSDSAVYLMEFGDQRWIAANRTVLNKSYNVFSHSHYLSDTNYLSESRNVSADWTWGSLVADIWGMLNLGAVPVFPTISNSGTPQNWKFLGVNAWVALHEVLSVFSLSVAYDPYLGYSFVELGKPQTPSPDLFQSIPSYDGTPIYEPLWDVPETVRVFFPVDFTNCGQEDDTVQSANWETENSVKSFDYTTGEGVPGSVIDLWGGQSQILDITNTPVTGLQSVANEMGSRWVQNKKTARRHKVFSGIRDVIKTGSEIRAVTHRFNGAYSETEFTSGPSLAVSIGQSGGISWDMQGENRSTPDLSRSTYPVYPRLPNLVRITGPVSGGESPGDELTVNADGLYEGKLVRRVGSTPTDIQDVFVQASLDSYNASAQMRLGQSVFGRLSGSSNDGSGNLLPVYVGNINGIPKSSAVLISLNSDIGQWVNTPGCSVVSGDIVSCSGTGGAVGETVDVVFPNLNSRSPFPKSGDYVSAVLSSPETSPKTYVIASDYSKSSGGGGGSTPQIFWGRCTEDKTAWAVSGCTTIDVQRADACDDSVSGTGSITVVLPKVQYKLPSLFTADVIAFAETVDENGDFISYVAVSDYTTNLPLWGLATADSEDGTLEVDGKCDYVMVRDASDCAGGGVDAEQTPFKVLLPQHGGLNHSILANDVVSFEIAEDGTRVIQSDYTTFVGDSVKWAVVQADKRTWADATEGGCPAVTVRACDDCAGSNPIAPDFNVVTPEIAGPFLPYLSVEDVIAYTTDASGTHVIVSDYTLAEIGIRPVELTQDMQGGTEFHATCKFLESGATDTADVRDRYNLNPLAVTADRGYASWIGRENRYEFIYLPCK